MGFIKEELLKLQDLKYRDFQAKLIPTIDFNHVIGVRTPNLRKLAKRMVKEKSYEPFLKELPHMYFDENQLHAFIISEMKDYDTCISYLDDFLPYVDNWATCDQMSPRIFIKHHSELLEHIKMWLKSKETYTIRFGIKMLMQHFLDEDFKEDYLRWVANIHSEEYYVNMMIAWFFATSLSKQYASTISYLKEQKLDSLVHNKTIQKAVESYRITEEQKVYLKSLKK